jgi:hypothetical protein
MDTHGFEIYPIIHKEKHYEILAPEAVDMTFVEVRAMLDYLEAMGAFTNRPDTGSEAGTLYTCELPGVTLEVDVDGSTVIVYRRTDP